MIAVVGRWGCWRGLRWVRGRSWVNGARRRGLTGVQYTIPQSMDDDGVVVADGLVYYYVEMQVSM